MNTQLLQSWLDLTTGTWPPPPHVLLGLPTTTDGAAAERRALKLMSKLRPHQLLHPELVTEGMNRLAQAMLVFARAAPPIAPAFAPAVDSVAREADATVPTLHRRLDVPTPVVFDAEIVEMKRPPTVRPRFSNLDPLDDRRPRPTVAIPELEARSAPFGRVSEDRRQAVRELRAICRLKEAWDQLGPFAGAPQTTAVTPGHTFALLDACDRFRAAWGRSGLEQAYWRDVGPLMIAVFELPAAWTVFCLLTLEQRERLASDWAVGTTELIAEIDARRIQYRRRRPRASIVSICGRWGRFLLRQPEIPLVVPILTLLLIAYLRS